MLKLDALAGDAVDVGRLVAHQAVGVGADVRDADIVAPDDEDVRFAPGRSRRWLRLLGLRDLCALDGIDGGGRRKRSAGEENFAAAEGSVVRLLGVFRGLLLFFGNGHFWLLHHDEDLATIPRSASSSRT